MTLKLKHVATAMAATVLLVGCSQSESEESEGVDLSVQALAAAEASGYQLPVGGDNGELHIYMWSD